MSLNNIECLLNIYTQYIYLHILILIIFYYFYQYCTLSILPYWF